MVWEDPKSAPAPLHVVQAFVNTAHRMRGTDELGTTDQASAALTALGFVDAAEPLDDAGRRRLVEFREALRQLLHARTDQRDLSDAAAALDRACSAIPFRARFSSGGRPTIASDPAATITHQVIGAVVAAIANAPNDWERLKACSNDACRWAFFDATRNRSGRWCDMNVCGVRHKMRTYRQRRR